MMNHQRLLHQGSRQDAIAILLYLQTLSSTGPIQQKRAERITRYEAMSDADWPQEQRALEARHSAAAPTVKRLVEETKAHQA